MSSFDAISRASRSTDARVGGVADHRRDDIAAPAVIRREIVAAAEADRGSVNRLLAEGAEAFALKGGRSVANLAAGEELLEPVVGSAGEDHAAQDFAFLVGRERCRDCLAPQKTIACVDHFADCQMKPVADADTWRRLGNGALQLLRGADVGRKKIGERLHQDPPERIAQRLDGRRIVLIDRLAARGHVERRDRRPQRERMPLRKE